MPGEAGDDIVTLIKKSGQQFSGIQAAVQPKMIFIPDDKIAIEDGDRLVRRLPSGLDESYLVKDRGYCPKSSLLPAHYQVKVERLDAAGIAHDPYAAGPAYALSGAGPAPAAASGAPAGQAEVISPRDLFQKLRKAIIDHLPRGDYSAWILAVDDMEKTMGTPGFIPSYQRFIRLASEHLALIAQFIPALSQMLG